MTRKLITFVSLIGLFILNAGSPGLAAPPVPAAWQTKLDPWVFETVASTMGVSNRVGEFDFGLTPGS